MSLKNFFINHLLIITIVFPLLVILFYGGGSYLALKYKHELYISDELQNYEKELRESHKHFLKEKAQYIESFMNFIYAQNKNGVKSVFVSDILPFLVSIKYDNGFIFFLQKKDNFVNIIRHPCGKKLLNLVPSNNQESIISKILNMPINEKSFIYYNGTDCVDNDAVHKVAFIYKIKTTNVYIVISEKDISYEIENKKKILEEKLESELRGNLELLLLVSFISIVFSLIFSKIMNMLIRSYEKEIKESNKAMFFQSRLAQAGELLSMISHQWRQPVSKIASVASNLRFQIMMGKDISTELLDKELHEIEDYTEFLSETIDDFKEFYKPKKTKELIYILPLIEKSLGFLEGEIVKKNISIIKDLDKDREVLIYQNELIQVLINIIQNAIELSKNKASIYIKTKVKLDEYIISIKDEAGGISDENILKVFDAHFSTKSDKSSANLGLGLYVSKVIIEKHFAGKLEVKSENNSSIFIIRLAL